MILRRCLHGHVGLHAGRRHVGRVWHRGDERGASSRLRRVRILNVSWLRLEGGRHTTTLSRAVAELVVGGITHLLVVVVTMGVVATSAASLRLEVASASVLALSRVS